MNGPFANAGGIINWAKQSSTDTPASSSKRLSLTLKEKREGRGGAMVCPREVRMPYPILRSIIILSHINLSFMGTHLEDPVAIIRASQQSSADVLLLLDSVEGGEEEEDWGEEEEI